MTAWVEEHLKVRLAKQLNALAQKLEDQGGVVIDRETWLAKFHPTTLTDMLDAAATGDLEPLRAKYPELAPYLHPRKRGRGERGFQRDWVVEAAVDDVFFIRELWARQFGRFKRGRDTPPSAEEIAAHFWNIDVRKIVSRMHNLSRSKSLI
jgi:hypothetical protein